ncbi:HopD, DNA-binding protein HU-beta (Synonym HupB) [Erwinia sp. Ejp617]|nr:HU family DNA-binding protein [Erwinia sp. Ejp617]ADP11797.1 HopD, DNA-binding protein HU-beta (Synonym HupB) [Erwinia sp. Ejp617]
MNKSQLIEKIAADADVSKAAVGRILEAFIDTVTKSLQAGEEVALLNFGTFSVRERAERPGRNPQTGKEITIAARKVAGFRAGKELREAVK